MYVHIYIYMHIHTLYCYLWDNIMMIVMTFMYVSMYVQARIWRFGEFWDAQHPTPPHSPTFGQISMFVVFNLRLDNTGACVIEVYPSLLCNWMSENVDLYIKLKLGIFSFI